MDVLIKCFVTYTPFLYVRALPGCNSEQNAATVLGYSQAVWDNESGKEPQPLSSDKAWGSLTEQEKEAAVILGYTEIIWDNKSGSELQPASVDKHWIDLTFCGAFLCMTPFVCCMLYGGWKCLDWTIMPRSFVTFVVWMLICVVYFVCMNMFSGSGHNSEQVAAEVLGYTQASWENLSGNEPQPASLLKSWSELTHSERVAAVVLGYTRKIWDNESGSELQPASAYKSWAELRSTTTTETIKSISTTEATGHYLCRPVDKIYVVVTPL